jgi:hypothetical protein
MGEMITGPTPIRCGPVHSGAHRTVTEFVDKAQYGLLYLAEVLHSSKEEGGGRQPP